MVLTEHVAPTIISANVGHLDRGAPFNITVYTTGEPAPASPRPAPCRPESPSPTTATAPPPWPGPRPRARGGSYPIIISASNASGTTTQAFTLTNSEAPSITSPATATFYPGSNGTYTVTTTGYPAATITEAGTLPAGLTFVGNGQRHGHHQWHHHGGRGHQGPPVTISATNSSGSTATLAWSSPWRPRPPTITSPATDDFNLGQAGEVAVTTTGVPAHAHRERCPAGRPELRGRNERHRTHRGHPDGGRRHGRHHRRHQRDQSRRHPDAGHRGRRRTEHHQCGIGLHDPGDPGQRDGDHRRLPGPVTGLEREPSRPACPSPTTATGRPPSPARPARPG